MTSPELSAVVGRMGVFPGALRVLLAPVSEGDARWRPASGAWSVLEIVNHLADEEVEDFGARLRSTLGDPTAAWAPIDPEGAAVARGYNDRSLGESLERFARLRAESVAWLGSLGGADWEAAYVHPSLGVLRAGDLLASWCAHDALHLRQVAKRLYELGGRDAGGYGSGYAGAW